MARILTVLAHPDDAEIWAGGTLARHVCDGDQALICSLVGEPGALRANEAGEGAQVLGAEVTMLEQKDRHLRLSDELVQKLAGLLADYRPAIIVTHWEQDSHPDHVLANLATRAAIVAASGLSQDLEMVLACDTYLSSGRDGVFTPEVYVDISDVWETKLAAIRQHASQDPEHYVQAIERQCWLHGARAKVRYAEGFRRIPVYGRLGGALSRLGRVGTTTARKRTGL
ncbi:MAG TPA: PIG-L family deacetylase [Chloroflexota bacterium]|nr:PIG-L family deacetylase [Chloroflexota bacterium]